MEKSIFKYIRFMTIIKGISNWELIKEWITLKELTLYGNKVSDFNKLRGLGCDDIFKKYFNYDKLVIIDPSIITNLYSSDSGYYTTGNPYKKYDNLENFFMSLINKNDKGYTNLLVNREEFMNILDKKEICIIYGQQDENDLDNQTFPIYEIKPYVNIYK